MWIRKIVFSGRALYLAIIISFIASVLAFMFILSRYYTYIEINRLNKQQELTDNVISAVHIAMQDPEFLTFDNEQEITLFNDSTRNCFLFKKHWGVYQIILAESHWKNITSRRFVLFGRNIGGPDAVGLYLTDHGHYLAVAGDTYLSGECYLPKLGVRKAYIDGKSFRYREIIHGTTHTSAERLPPLSVDLFKYFESELFSTGNPNDSLVTAGYLNKGDFEQSFRKKTIRVYDADEIVLANIDIKGNYIVQSAKKITIRRSADLEDILCIAPIIEVADDFSGTLQLFALDSLLLHDDVNLTYPSALVISGFGRSSVFMDISSGSKVAGSVMLFTDSEEGAEVMLTIDEDAEISGMVYCAGKVSHKGSVIGSLYCDRFFLQTRQGYYENHLLDARIDPSGLAPEFTGGIVSDRGTGKNRNRIIKWLN